MTAPDPLPCAIPIVQAPMAGGPSTPALAAAVSTAGGLGFLAGGYLAPDTLAEEVRQVRAQTSSAFGVNVFCPPRRRGDPDAIAAYRREILPEAQRLGVSPGEPTWDDDGYEAKLEVVRDTRPAVVSFTFGCPSAEILAGLQSAGIATWVTVTSPTEARSAEAAGADALCVQGMEAGGHRGIFDDDPSSPTGGELVDLLSLLPSVAASVELPLVAAGGLMTGADIAGVLASGAVAAQMGTAFLCCAEAGTSAVHRRAILEGTAVGTIVTRAYSGRPGRGLANRFAAEHADTAPAAYPEIHHLTRPLRAAAAAAGDGDVPNLWAGLGWRQVTDEPAADLVARLAASI